MRIMSPRHALPRTIALVATAVALVTGLAGCVGAPTADVSFEQKIPAALEGAGLGLSDAWASRSTDGFTVVLNVGAVSTAADVSDAELRRILQLIEANNTLGGDRLDLTVRSSSGDRIDLEPAAVTLGADPSAYRGSVPTALSLSWDEVTRILH